MYCKAKKNSEQFKNFWKFLFLEIYIIKKGLKGGISIDADSGPPRYVLWCCGGICHQLLFFLRLAVAILWVALVFLTYLPAFHIKILSGLFLLVCNKWSRFHPTLGWATAFNNLWHNLLCSKLVSDGLQCPFVYTNHNEVSFCLQMETNKSYEG